MTQHEVRSTVYLKQGQMLILEHPTLVSTILGSCVAVTFYNPRLGLAAISHALLPHCRRHVYHNSVNDLLTGDCARCADAFKYVDCSVSMMAEAFSRFGIAAAETRVQLYGGAAMIVSRERRASPETVGEQNTAVARRVLADHGLAIQACDVGGTAGRKLVFNTLTGEVKLSTTRENRAGAPGKNKTRGGKAHG
jgi:chemotaxis protein CheD